MEVGASVGAGCYPPPVFDAGKHVLDLVAQTVEVSVVRDRDLPTCAGRDARGNPHLDQCVAEPIGILAPICQQRPGLRKRGQKRPCPDVIRGLACGQKHPDRAALRIGQDVQFGVQAALCAPDQPPAPPFFSARLDAVRRVFKWVASIIIVSVCLA